MVVVILIGLLASLAIPAFLGARDRSQASSLANNFRIYAGAFEIFATENGHWPPDATHGQIPVGMEDSLSRFSEESIVGGNWDWEQDAVGVTAGISLRASSAAVNVFERIDAILDDGNLGGGLFILNGDRVTYILEP